MVRAPVLIVDDQPENITVLGDLLSAEFPVRTATSGARALELARIEPQPELVLLDLMMPGMDGFEVLRRLTRDPATRDIPVIIVTAMEAVAAEERGLALGAVDYIVKPFKAPLVLARVRAQVELKRARDRLAAQNDWLEAEVERRLQDNLRIQNVAILALARLAEVRDNETGNHLRRTQAYVRILAEHLARQPRYAARLDSQTIDLIAKSAPLHDIGKVGIPDHILLKPGRLTGDEWLVMKTHAALGAEALERAEADLAYPMAFFNFAKQIARHHHERWDGSGYPDGLAGEAIPLAARLMALADVFDALISRRTYKEAFPVARARELILAERGRHFDPQVVDAFAAEFEAFCAIAARYSDDEAQPADAACVVTAGGSA
ncbi:MAG: two-component system response regulator [Gammaproteobacteria bacterium]|nr:two-component system response regulator [Gammaproteobacteria bacterium]MCP5199876.1 two-component system response regulator [Gammaproteobacteria bacterium]